MKAVKKFIFTVIIAVLGFSGGFTSAWIYFHQISMLHRAYLMTPDFYEKAYAELSDEYFQASALLVNHHLLAPHFIARAFNGIRTMKPKNVILISPDHFYQGARKATATLYDWRTPYGTLRANRKTIKNIAQESLISIDPLPFEKEHGISTIDLSIRTLYLSGKIHLDG